MFSDLGTNDEFVRQFAEEFMELMGATSIVNPRLQEVKDAFMEVLIEGLIPAYVNLRQIRVASERRIPVIERRQQFENLSGALWRTYKTLMPKATILLGFDLGFLFMKPAKYKAGEIAFRAAHPQHAHIADFLQSQNRSWQQGLKEFRNEFIEHRNVGRQQFADFYKPETAEFLFETVCATMARIFPVFIASHFNGSFTIEEIPLAERDPNHRRRFRWTPKSR
jgi:hypothetical protein